MKVKRISLGFRELTLLMTLEKENRKIFTINDAKRILKTSDASVKNVLKRLVKKHRITRIKRGEYVLSPAKSGIEGFWAEHPFLVISKIIKQYYIGFWTALNYWGMTEQIPRTVFIVALKQRRSINYGNQKYQFIKFSQNKFFGYIKERVEDRFFNISSREKTIADCLLFPKYCGGITEITKAVWSSRKELDWKELMKIINLIKVDAAKRRLGYILEALKIKRDLQRKLLKKKFTGFRWLDPSSQKERFEYSKKWGLKVNVKKEQLLGWRGY
ncbi:MAG: hypothetical protein ISS95_00905 [Candidatus Aenigmarchaeota archaeon]|nr:hypothetical protein [Candidatus Aenigmarchaeota archaeon]